MVPQLRYIILSLLISLTAVGPFSAEGSPRRCESAFAISNFVEFNPYTWHPVAFGQKLSQDRGERIKWAIKRYSDSYLTADSRYFEESKAGRLIHMLDDLNHLLAFQGKDFHDLVSDWGIANHIEEFKTFVYQHRDARALTVKQLRDEFAHSLGSSRVFRGVYLTEGDLARVRSHGLLPPALHFKKGFSEADPIDVMNNESLENIQRSRQNPPTMRTPDSRGLHRLNPMQSVTSFKPLAAAVPLAFARKKWFSKGAIYVFEIEVPNLLLIQGRDPKVESFWLGEIPPEMIRSVEKFDVDPKQPIPNIDELIKQAR